MKLGLLNNKTVEDSSSPSTSLPSNMAVPPPTTNPSNPTSSYISSSSEGF